MSVLTVLLVSCGAKKGAVGSGASRVEPTWHTCLIQGARATVRTEDNEISAAITLQAVRDSMIVVSIMPMLGMEMIRLEATPTDIIVIDKFNGQYLQATYADLNKLLTPNLNYDILQQLCSAELPTGGDKARLQHTFGDQTIELVITYAPRQIDVPVRVFHQRLDKYTPMGN